VIRLNRILRTLGMKRHQDIAIFLLIATVIIPAFFLVLCWLIEPNRRRATVSASAADPYGSGGGTTPLDALPGASEAFRKLARRVIPHIAGLLAFTALTTLGWVGVAGDAGKLAALLLAGMVLWVWPVVAALAVAVKLSDLSEILMGSPQFRGYRTGNSWFWCSFVLLCFSFLGFLPLSVASWSCLVIWNIRMSRLCVEVCALRGPSPRPISR